MKFSEFQERAKIAWESIPQEFRREITDLAVHEGQANHPELPHYLTLGECVPDPMLDDSSTWTSTIHLYYGSFAELASQDPNFDWEEEIRETVFHELRHHIEDRAGNLKLLSEDYAEEENEKRIAGLAFDPFFYRAGETELPHEYWVGATCFLEVQITPRKLDQLRGKSFAFTWRDENLEFVVPERPFSSQFIAIPGGWQDEEGNRGDLWIALHVRKSFF